jgi:type IV pilus assembly protein PilP
MKPTKTILCLGVSLGLLGCGAPEHEDLKGWMIEQTKGMKGKVQPLPEITAFPAVAYEGDSLTPPFSGLKILTTDSTSDKSAPDRERARQALENFPLEDLKLIGVLFDGKSHYALIRTPAPNKPKHVRVGEFVGQNFGKITAINGEGMTVLETVKDSNGAWIERETNILVPNEGGKK